MVSDSTMLLDVAAEKLKEHSTVNRFEKFRLFFFSFVVCNPCQSSPFLTILVPLLFIIISVVFFSLCTVLFSGFLQINSNFVDGQNNSKYRE